ncbi:hypothetical protein BC826DRAFT_1103128 [Russula brevipes]|nr:hypothetical protein BC826DRAFT_1103128 [Russula brevipes]
MPKSTRFDSFPFFRLPSSVFSILSSSKAVARSPFPPVTLVVNVADTLPLSASRPGPSGLVLADAHRSSVSGSSWLNIVPAVHTLFVFSSSPFTEVFPVLVITVTPVAVTPPAARGV